MSPLPKSVQKDVEAADRLQAQIIGSKAGALAPDPETGAIAPLTDSAGNVIESGAPPAGNEPVEQDAAYWKNRFTSMKSYHDSVVPGLRQEVAQLQGDVQRLSQSNLGQSNQPTSSALKLSDEDIEHIGAENVGTVTRIVQHEVASARNAITQEAAAREKQEQQKLWDRFQSDLASLVPQYVAINAMGEWKYYLGAVTDQATGQSLQSLLDIAAKAGDANAAAAIFGDFQAALNTNVSGYNPGVPVNFPGRAQAAQQPSALNPAMARSPSQPVEAGEQIEVWDRTEIDAFWVKYRKFVSSPGRPDPARAKEYEETIMRIQAAEAENRVDENR